MFSEDARATNKLLFHMASPLIDLVEWHELPVVSAKPSVTCFELSRIVVGDGRRIMINTLLGD